MSSLTPERLVQRYVVVHEPRSSELILSAGWFVLLLMAFFVGSGALAVLFAATAGIGALQLCGRWAERRQACNPVLAGFGAAALPLAAYISNRVLGAAILLLVAAVMLFPAGFVIPTVVGSTSSKGEQGTPSSPIDLAAGLVDGWVTLGAIFIPGLAAASVVQVHRIDAMSLVFLGSALCTYDAGDHLCGAGFSSRLIGPLSGMFGVLVVTASMQVIGPDPFDGASIWLTGLALALLAPMGQWLGSWLLPRADTPAPGLRRLDSWFVAAPFFWLVVAVAA